MDYAICNAFNYKSEGLQEGSLAYDVGCQWCRWFLWRVLHSPYLSVPRKMKFFYTVGKFHLGDHILDCFPKFTLNFLVGSGLSSGESCEPLWSPLKLNIRCTRSMTSAHRDEFIDDQMKNSNFMKMVHMGTIVYPVMRPENQR